MILNINLYILEFLFFPYHKIRLVDNLSVMLEPTFKKTIVWFDWRRFHYLKKMQVATSLRHRVTSSYLTLAFGVVTSFSCSGSFILNITIRNSACQYYQAQNNTWAMTDMKTLVILLLYWLFFSQACSVAQCLMFLGGKQLFDLWLLE